MLNTYREWFAVAAVGAVALVKFAPEYSIRQSYLWTGCTILPIEFTIWFIYAVILYPRFLSPLRGLPGPSGNSFLNGQFTTIRAEPSGLPQRRWINEVPNNGLIRYLFLGNKERVLLTSPEALREVLQMKSYIFTKPSRLRFSLIRLLGEGLLLAEGDEHKAQRRNLNPAFSFRHIKELYPVFWNKGIEMNNKLEQYFETASDNVVEVGDWVSRATLDIIGLAGMGRDFNTLDNPDNALSRSYKTLVTPTREAQILGLLGFFFPAWLLAAIPVKRNEDVNQASKVARRTALEMVEEKKKQIQEKGRSDIDIISVALESGFFTDEELVNQMMTFLLAGHETTASSMQWAIYALSTHPEIQTRLRTEIHIHLHPSTPITSQQLDSLPYLHAFCLEVLRFHAPVPMTLRSASVPTTILSHPIPASTTVIICPWAVNFSTALWGPSAPDFDPSRWLTNDDKPNNDGGAKSNYAFLTFNHGVRSCIGRDFAVAEFKTLVATWVGRWECELKDPNEVLEIKGGVTARPKGGMNVRVKKVEWE